MPRVIKELLVFSTLIVLIYLSVLSKSYFLSDKIGVYTSVVNEGNRIYGSGLLHMSVKDMMASSDIVIVGSIVDVPYEKNYEVETSSGTRAEIGLHLPIRIESVIKGTVNSDDLSPSLHIGTVINGEKFMLEGMKTAKLGDRMVFFIKRTAYNDAPFYSILNGYQGFYKLKGELAAKGFSTNFEDSSSAELIADDNSPFMDGVTVEELRRIEAFTIVDKNDGIQNNL